MIQMVMGLFKSADKVIAFEDWSAVSFCEVAQCKASGYCINTLFGFSGRSLDTVDCTTFQHCSFVTCSNNQHWFKLTAGATVLCPLSSLIFLCASYSLSFSLPFYSLPLLLFLSPPPCFPDSLVPRADVPSWAEEAAAGAKQVSQEDVIVFIATATRSACASPEQSLQPLPLECPSGAPWTSPP